MLYEENGFHNTLLVVFFIVSCCVRFTVCITGVDMCVFKIGNYDMPYMRLLKDKKTDIWAGKERASICWPARQEEISTILGASG